MRENPFDIDGVDLVAPSPARRQREQSHAHIYAANAVFATATTRRSRQCNSIHVSSEAHTPRHSLILTRAGIEARCNQHGRHVKKLEADRSPSRAAFVRLGGVPC
jgi:hypothetical protein